MSDVYEVIRRRLSDRDGEYLKYNRDYGIKWLAISRRFNPNAHRREAPYQSHYRRQWIFGRVPVDMAQLYESPLVWNFPVVSKLKKSSMCSCSKAPLEKRQTWNIVSPSHLNLKTSKILLMNN